MVWLGSLSVSLGLFLSPLIVAFCRRKSTRLTAVFGGLTAALGCLFTSFASQMHQVFLSYGFVMALGLSLARVTSSLMIGQYFKRRREKVEAIVTSGTGCGVIIFSYSFAKIIKGPKRNSKNPTKPPFYTKLSSATESYLSPPMKYDVKRRFCGRRPEECTPNVQSDVTGRRVPQECPLLAFWFVGKLPVFSSLLSEINRVRPEMKS
ncbi:Monocarboxylate transporter 14 like protein [Argiope bruennichi]|uniref:Monocarboxylate transporter 14 like protein n=1 Tax=Argiope bruennichi TaxID=94029 RepID=A0A8T0ERU6_ARGBR|nr:Monocarboxylate transporter 14 like protein [Argiope bruennichi]